jgi:hypothetical protein
VVKGNSNNLMKVTAKRRRTKAQIRMDKLAAAEKESDITKQLGQLDDLKKQMTKMQT